MPKEEAVGAGVCRSGGGGRRLLVLLLGVARRLGLTLNALEGGFGLILLGLRLGGLVLLKRG